MRTIRLFCVIALLAACAAFAQQKPSSSGWSQGPTTAAPVSNASAWSLVISGDETWKDTGIDVQAGDLLRYEASGQLKFPDSASENGPGGLPRGWRDLLRALPLNELGRGALIGRIGDSAGARPFFIGEKREARSPVGGRLYLGTNQGGGGAPATGSYRVNISRLERVDSAPAPYTGPLPQMSKEQWKQIPYRVTDPDGTEGDLVNFIIFGMEDQIKDALLSMGWVIVDKSIKDTILRGALGALSKQAYLTIPMSPLTVFGRVQDYGFAHSDPIMTAAERHHFRLWKAPFGVDGQEVWVGAGTHDVGFDRDQRNGKITHRIDSDVDKEREFIGDSLRLSGNVVKLDHYERENPIKEAKTAHGQEFFSDGRVLLIYMKPDRANLSSGFADTFCSVLAQHNPDGGDWGPCGDWLEPTGKTEVKLGEIPNKYRLLVVPGIMNTCVADTPAYELGRKLLGEKYGLSTDIIPVPNDSSEDNARMIAEYLREKGPQDPRPFIVLGYSKGTPDVQVMLATEPEARKYVAGFISVAGASGGSPIADSIPEQVERYGGHTNKASCKGDATQGMKSLRRDERQKFLSSYPHPFVPTYSLPVLLSEEEAKKSKLSTAAILSTYDKDHDGQVLKRDAIIPESAYLGAAKSDHLAVALNFEKAEPGTKGKYPRAALLEALVRFVVDDLTKRPGQPQQPAAETKKEPSKSWVEGWTQKK